MYEHIQNFGLRYLQLLYRLWGSIWLLGTWSLRRRPQITILIYVYLSLGCLGNQQEGRRWLWLLWQLGWAKYHVWTRDTRSHSCRCHAFRALTWFLHPFARWFTRSFLGLCVEALLGSFVRGVLSRSVTHFWRACLAGIGLQC